MKNNTIRNLKINAENIKKLAKRGGAIVLATAGLITVLKGCAPKKQETEVIENKTGYTDINPLFNLKVKDSDFVILNVGDHNTKGTFKQNYKIKKCNDSDISVGIIVTTDAVYENEIYDDVELVKQIASKYTIDMPVYLNIDKIIENTSINVEQKTKLILDFLEKCSSNGFYCGIHGKDSNLVRVKKYCNITKYDALVVIEGDEIQYDGSYKLYQDKTGKINATKNLAEVITEKNFNNATKFVPDGRYTVGDNNIDDIAMEYGMSVDELLKFNNIKKSEINSDTILRIPCIIDKTIPSNTRGTKVEEPLRGCDLSHHQKDENISWDKFSKNMDFIILKASQGNKTDDSFDKKATICNELAIPIGAYCYNNVRFSLTDKREYKNEDGTLDKESFENAARQQIKTFLSQLKNKKIDYPCYIDIEATNNTEKTDDLTELYTKESLNILLNIWKEEMEKAGYIPGLYTNKDGLNQIIKLYNNDEKYIEYIINNFEIWIAGGKNYKTIMTFDEAKDKIPKKNEKSRYISDGKLFDDIDTWQISETVIIDGYNVKNKYIDFDFSKKDYTKKDYTISNDIDEINETEFEIKDIEKRRNIEQLLNIAKKAGLSATAIATGATAGIFISNKISKKNKRSYRRTK